MGQSEQAEALLQERLDIGRQLGDPDVIAWTLLALVGFIRERGGLEAARAARAEARTLFERLDDARGLATCLRAYGYDEQRSGHLDAARAYYDSSLSICLAKKDVWGIGESKRYLAAVAEALGDLGKAREDIRDAVLLLDDVGEQDEARKARTAISELG
jgi:tetratricopeptide (TPR) repeat protein